MIFLEKNEFLGVRGITKKRARKQWNCSLCGGKIVAGQVYILINGLIHDNRFSRVKICSDCFQPPDWIDDLARTLRFDRLE